MKFIAVSLFISAFLSFTYAFSTAKSVPKQNTLSRQTTLAPQQQPEELGAVNWLRDMEAAVQLSKQSNKPILILFQEIPGCATCRNYGNDVLSHPLVVEAIETFFVPMAVYNNKKGKDAEWLKYFGEPSWNNPVVRIVDNQKQNIIPRLNGNYSKWGLTDAMLRALDVRGFVAPEWLELLAEEFSARQEKTATFGMYCFWSGEREIGALEGVTATEPGFMGGREVVRVKYNPDRISFEDLAQEARKAQCNSHIYTDSQVEKKTAAGVVGVGQVSAVSDFRLDKDVKYYLSKTPYRHVPMTQLQAARVNSRIAKGEKFGSLLSPQQHAWVQKIKAKPEMNWPNVINQDIREAYQLILLQNAQKE